uniref:CSON005502 protein n=1 Tax=Culicoides sonorensis TaxID=179676 RepID=A0A336L7L6_CULSO
MNPNPPNIPIHIQVVPKFSCVEFAQNGTFLKKSASPGVNAIAPKTAVTINIIAYIKRDDVEFRQLGHAEQHKLQAVPVQQQAN